MRRGIGLVMRASGLIYKQENSTGQSLTNFRTGKA